MSGFDGECKGGPYHGQTRAYPHEQMPVYWQEGVFVHTGMYTFIGSKWRYSGPPYRAPTSPLSRPHGGIEDCDCIGAVIGQHDRSCPLASHQGNCK